MKLKDQNIISLTVSRLAKTVFVQCPFGSDRISSKYSRLVYMLEFGEIRQHTS